MKTPTSKRGANPWHPALGATGNESKREEETTVGRATLHIEADALLTLACGPHTADAITRDRYFRLYHFPGMYSGAVAEGMRALRMAPGRGTGPYFGEDGGDKFRFGRGPSTEATVTNFVRMAARGAIEHPGAIYAAAGGSFPDSSASRSSGILPAAAVEPTMKVAHNRAVAPADQQAAGDLVVRWLDALREAGAPPPGFFSPVNEPDASWKSGPNSPLDHAKFARALALRLRDKHPDVRVSGPCTAWPYPGEYWERWNSSGWERSFIENVGDVAGAYDFHLYTKELWAYGPESPGFASHQKLPTPNLFASLSLGHSEIMEFGKSEVLLDLVQTLHLAQWGRPSPPVLISEFGRQGITPQLGPWASDYLSFLYGTTVTRLWLGLMNRPEVAMTVPFILPESDIGYGPQRGQTLATRPGSPADPETRVTPLAGFAAFFREVAGQRVPVSWRVTDPALSRGLFAVACRTDSDILVLLHNSTPEPLDGAIETEGIGPWPTGVRVARMRWEGPAPLDHHSPNPARAHWRRDAVAEEPLEKPSFRLEGEETALVRIPRNPPAIRRVILSRHYAPEFLQPLCPGAELSFALSQEMIRGAVRAQLVLGFAAPRGPDRGSGRLRVSWTGGTPVIAELGLSAGWRQVAVPVAVDVPSRDLPSGPWIVRMDDNDGTLPEGSLLVSARLEIRTEEPVEATP